MVRKFPLIDWIFPSFDAIFPSPDEKFPSFQKFDDAIFAFFTLEMIVKMVAMGVTGKGSYLAETWNRLDFFIVAAG